MIFFFFVIIGFGLWLCEKVGMVCWVVIFIGFIGVMIIFEFWVDDFNFVLLFFVGVVFFWVSYFLMVKKFFFYDLLFIMVVYLLLLIILFNLLLVLFDW